MTRLTNDELTTAIKSSGGIYCRIIRTGRPVYVFDIDNELEHVGFVARDASGINGKGNGTYTTHYSGELKEI
jgi:hypothetical protein